MSKTKTPAHDRTPENTPLPGGGSWQWDEHSGAWMPLEPAEQTTGPMTPVFAETIPQDKE
jgi:hypothetical protein